MNLTKDIYLVCGVPGAGKTWVCRQVKDKYTYVPHDEYIDGTLIAALKRAAQHSEKPLLTECPFGERVLKARLEMHGFKVHPMFISEHLTVISNRWGGREVKSNSSPGLAPKNSQREKLLLPLSTISRIKNNSIETRAKEWNAPCGPSTYILEVLLNGDNGRERA